MVNFLVKNFRHIIYNLCRQSSYHLEKTVKLFEENKQNLNKSLFLPIIIIYDYLKTYKKN